MRAFTASFCALVAFATVICDVQEHGHSYLTRNVTVENGACIFERNTLPDGETKALHDPCVIATCYAARREVNATLSTIPSSCTSPLGDANNRLRYLEP
uniref:Secreted protein n=1 Tax=Amblyomma cajennense TaxID=34607 RepID=A0A023FBL4_AMBCJ